MPGGSDSESPHSHHNASGSGAGSQLPRRGARACINCRRGKNRCVSESGNAPCKRCATSGVVCVFESAPAKGFDEERVERLERTISSLQATVEGLAGLFRGGAGTNSEAFNNNNNSNQPSFGSNDAHLHSLAGRAPAALPQPEASIRLDADFNSTSPPNAMHWDQLSPSNSLGPLLSQPSQLYHHHPPTIPPIPPIPPIPTVSFAVPGPSSSQSFNSSSSGNSLKRPRPVSSSDPPHLQHPLLPNYRAPPHPISQYGLVPSTVPSDDEDSLPTASLTAPFEALAEAAAAAAGDPTPLASGAATPKKRKRRRRRMPPPPNAFPDVIEKGLVTDAVGRHIFSFYFAHCHVFFPILDEKEDTWEAMRQRTPWTIDSILATAASRMPDPSTDVAAAAEHSKEEAEGIARSSLFGPTVRKEGVQAMALLAAFSANGYLATGHALRMTYELGLHRALDKIMAGAEKGKVRREDEEKDLLASSRIFLGLYWLDFVLSTGSGRPHFCDEELVGTERLAAMLRHPLSIDTDISLVANIELISIRSRIDTMMRGSTSFDSRTADFARRSSRDLTGWFKKWDSALAERYDATSFERRYDEASFERKNLASSLHSASIFLASTALRGSNLADVDNLSVDARELAMGARQDAVNLIELWLHTPSLRQSLRYATQTTFVDISFSALLLLKLSRLFPEGTELQQVVDQCHELQGVLREIIPAERFGITVMVALERFSKAFSIELPTVLLDNNGVTSNDFFFGMAGLGGAGPSYGASAVGSDPNWVGSDTVPQWLNDPLAWSFTDLDMSAGLDKIFLPSWSTQVDGYGGYGGYSAEW